MRSGASRLTGLLALLSCAGSTGPTEQQSEHFAFTSTLNSSTVSALGQGVEREYARILTDLGVSSMGAVRVTIYNSNAAMADAVRPFVGQIPVWSTGLVTGRDQIHLLAPGAGEAAPYAQTVQVLVHEFAHCVSMQVNPRIGNNPRWLWESVAIYEARQQVDPRTLDYMRAGTPPTLAELSSMADTRVYAVGYTITEFIVETWGRPAVNRLITSNGDLGATLGVTASAFERDWYAFVKARYGL